MSGADAQARARLAIEMLTARYRAGAAALCDQLDALAARLATDPGDAAALAELAHEVHKTHGTAGSLGFDAASERCAALEERVGAWAADPALDRGERAAIVAALARGLRADFGIDGAVPPE